MSSREPRQRKGFRFWTWFGRGMAIAIIGGAIALLLAVVLYALLL